MNSKLCLRCKKLPCDGSDDGGAFSPDNFCCSECATDDWKLYSEIPKTFLQTDISRLNSGLVAAVLRWATNWKRKPGLICYGSPDAGKTRLATYALQIRAVGCWCGVEEDDQDTRSGEGTNHVWLNTRMFNSRYGHVLKDYESKAKWVDELCATKFLLLDDISKIKTTPGILGVLFDVLDDRLSRGEITILTSNRIGSELEAIWTKADSESGKEYGPPLVRRLREFCAAINFDAPTSNIIPLEETA